MYSEHTKADNIHTQASMCELFCLCIVSGTLHDTFGICIQNIPSDHHATEREKSPDSTIVDSRSRKRKRTISIPETDLEPYRKKPEITTFNYTLKDPVVPDNVIQMKRRDDLWMFSHAFHDRIPMWGGWNSRFTLDTLPRQKIGYMENINLPPTRLDVVVETMKLSQKLAAECGEQYAVVTYDLAVAKPALQIQVEESPTFDNVFVCFGAFHIQLAYFSCLGFLLAESGGPQILTDTGVLSPGSLNSFISGKHYNRCKRLHPLLATAISVLHFQSFLEKEGPLPDNLLAQLNKLHDMPSPESLSNIESTIEYKALMRRYEVFTDETRSEKHGITGKYWIMYLDLVKLYLLLSRAVHTNDLDLFTYCIGEMCPLFFATNHPNYARYMVRYHLNLLNIDITHPGASDILRAGGLSVKLSHDLLWTSPSSRRRRCFTNDWGKIIHKKSKCQKKMDDYTVNEERNH